MAEMVEGGGTEGVKRSGDDERHGGVGSSHQTNQMCCADDLFRVLKPLQAPTMLCWRSHRKDNLAMWEKKGRPARSLVTQRLYAELHPISVPRSFRSELVKTACLKDFSGMRKVYSFSPDSPSSSYGLEFTLDGRLVLSCHDDGVIRGLDSRTHELEHQYMAHDDCCNGATMIDHYTFASYSDDMTIKVWDLRNTSRKVKLIGGHTGWVKNVSVVPGSKKLLSSGFDSYIRICDTNSPEQELMSEKVMTFPQLLRTQLSPDGDFLVLTTRKSHVYVIKNLDLEDLPKEYAKYFAPPESRKIPYPMEPNLLELLHYTPRYYETHPGYSLDIHPQGDCCIVRHHPVQNNSATGVRKFDFVAVYDISTTKYSKIKYLQEEYLRNPEAYMNKSIDYDFFSPKIRTYLRNYEVIDETNTRQEDQSCLLWRVNDILLKETDAKAVSSRMNEIVSNWEGYGASGATQNVAKVHKLLGDAQFFGIAHRAAAPNQIIKEISFDSTGKLMAIPVQNGFKVLGFSNDLEDYKYMFSHKSQTFNNCPRLKTILQFESPHFSCYSVKFSPIENDKIVASGRRGILEWYHVEKPDCV